MHEPGFPLPEETAGDRSNLEWVCPQIEDALRRIGGTELLDDARAEAEWFVALFFPYDGLGAEPTERLRARLGILIDRLDRALRSDDAVG